MHLSLHHSYKHYSTRAKKQHIASHVVLLLALPHPMQKEEEHNFRNVGRNARTGVRLSLEPSAAAAAAAALARASCTAAKALDRGSGNFPSRQPRTSRDSPETVRWSSSSSLTLRFGLITRERGRARGCRGYDDHTRAKSPGWSVSWRLVCVNRAGERGSGGSWWGRDATASLLWDGGRRRHRGGVESHAHLCSQRKEGFVSFVVLLREEIMNLLGCSGFELRTLPPRSTVSTLKPSVNRGNHPRRTLRRGYSAPRVFFIRFFSLVSPHQMASNNATSFPMYEETAWTSSSLTASSSLRLRGGGNRAHFASQPAAISPPLTISRSFFRFTSACFIIASAQRGEGRTMVAT